MPIAVPGMARISVVSASIVLLNGALVRPMIQAIGTPTTRQISTASPQYRNEFRMNFGVSTLTRVKNAVVYSTGNGVSDQPRPKAASVTPMCGRNEMNISVDRNPTASQRLPGERRRRSTFVYVSEL